MNIALVCSGLGYVWRGLERFTYELFQLVKEDLPITLFGCHMDGRPKEISLPCLKNDRLLSVFKGRARDNYYFQQLSYALSFIPYLVWHAYDLVHYSEPALGSFLWHAKKRFRFKYRLLFTNWGMERNYCFRPDYLQEITPPAYQETLNSRIPPTRVTFLPYGIQSRSFLTSLPRNVMREKYGIPKEKIVILSVAALNRRHKRIHYLIDEINRLGDEYFLFVVGHPEEPDLIPLGQKLLGGRFKSMYVPFDKMPEIYSLSDLFVIPSLVEGFCLALVEAMCAGLPVIAHDSPNFQWLVVEPRNLVDLRREGNLAEKIKEVAGDYVLFQQIAKKNRMRIVEQFDWSRLKSQYLSMYERLLLSVP